MLCVTIWLHKGCSPLCVLVSVTAVNHVSLLAQTAHYCGLCKVAIVLSQLAGGTKRRFRITCFTTLRCRVLRSLSALQESCVVHWDFLTSRVTIHR